MPLCLLSTTERASRVASAAARASSGVRALSGSVIKVSTHLEKEKSDRTISASGAGAAIPKGVSARATINETVLTIVTREGRVRIEEKRRDEMR